MPSTTPSTVYIEISSADGSSSRRIIAPDMILREVGNDAAQLDFVVVEDVDSFAANFGPESLCQMIRNGVVEFDGNLSSIAETAANGTLRLQVTAVDKLAWLDGVLAGRDGNAICEWSSPIVRLTNQQMRYLAGTNEFNPDSVYPVYPAASSMTNSPSSSSPWIARSASRSTTLHTAIANGSSTAPIRVTDITQFRAPGFLHVDSELIWFGFTYPDASYDGTGYLGGIIRGVLGSTGAAHSAGANVYQRELKCIAQTGVLEIANSGAWLDNGSYQVKHTDGRFDFQEDPSSMSLVANYSVYDSDAAGAETIAGVVQDVFAMPNPQGLALTSSSWDMSALETIPVHRVAIDDITPARAWVQRLLDDWFSRGNPATKFIQFDYDSQNGVYRLASITQNSTPDYVFDTAIEVRRNANNANYYNGIAIRYISYIVSSLVSPERCYHLAIGDAANHATPGGTNTEAVSALMTMQTDRQDAAGWTEVGTAGNNVNTGYLFDGRPDTGWGIVFGNNFYTAPDPATNLLFCWFEEPQVLDSVRLIFDARNYVGTTDLFIEVVGYDSYTPGDPPTLGNVVELPASLSYRIRNGGGMTQGPGRSWILNVPGRGY